MSAVFAFFLSKLIRVGNIEIETADGVKRRYGDGTGPSIAVKLRDRAAEWRLMRDPTLTLGELYMDGRFEVVRGDIYDVIALGARNLHGRPAACLGQSPGEAAGLAARLPAAQRSYASAQQMSPGTTITTGGSTICSSTPIGNIRAPISSIPAKASMKRSSPKSATSRPRW